MDVPCDDEFILIPRNLAFCGAYDFAPGGASRQLSDGQSSGSSVDSGVDALLPTLIKDYIRPRAHWRHQEGVTQTLVNSEREIFLRNHEITALSLDSIENILRTEITSSDDSRARLASAISQYMRNKHRLFEQAKTLQHVESKLGQLRYRVTEIDEALGAEFEAFLTRKSGMHPDERNEDHECMSQWDCEHPPRLPSPVREYYDQFEVVYILEDQLTELESEHTDQLRIKKSNTSQASSHSTAEEDSETNYRSRRLILEAQLDSARRESSRLKNACYANGQNPEHFRWRRLSSCSGKRSSQVLVSAADPPYVSDYVDRTVGALDVPGIGLPGSKNRQYVNAPEMDTILSHSSMSNL